MTLLSTCFIIILQGGVLYLLPRSVIEGKMVEGDAAEEKVVEDTRVVEETQAVEVKSASAAASCWQRYG